MEIKEEIEFNEAKRKFEESYDIILKAISAYEKSNQTDREKMGISEVDYIRLCQFSQRVQIQKPKRDFIFQEQQNEKSKRISLTESLSHVGQNLAKLFSPKRKKQNENEIINFPNSYLLVDKCETQMVELIHCDNVLKNQNQENVSDIEKMLDAPPAGQIVKEVHDGPGILDDYRQGNWGVERICLDGMQNHLPSDSKGTACFLHFLIDDEWVDARTAKLSPEKITKVRFADNGVGFIPENLLFLHSTKSSEDRSVGQFGEGMKLASMASINLGLNMELQSRNWSARAIGETQPIVNTRENDKIEERKKLVYDIKEYDGEPIVGSRTIFHTPTPEFIDFALNLPEYILQLNPDYKPAFTTEHGDIVTHMQGGKAFIKGVFVKNINSIFSYNFDKADVNPDRNDITNFNVQSAIIQIVRKLSDLNIIKTLIAKIIDWKRNNTQEFYNSNRPIELEVGECLYNDFIYGRGVPSLWNQAFKEVCEHNDAVNEDGTRIEAVLKTDYEVPEQLSSNLAKYNVVSLPKYWSMAMQKAGIKIDRESLPEYMQEVISTSLTLNYGEKIWDDERIALDAVQNHLPSDSGGYNIFLRFQTSDGIWHDFREFPNFDDTNIKKVKISDDGRGYDSKNLGLFASVKEHEVSSGKWGEGLKMLAAATIRKGIKIELRSKGWLATANTQNEILNENEENEKKVQRLIFDVITKVNSGSEIIADGDNPPNVDHGYTKARESSSTTFIDPTPELIKEFRNIKEKVLAFEKNKSIVNSDYSEVISLNGGKLFIRNIFVPGNHNIKYSYHFKKFNVETRDRNAIERKSLQEQLRDIFANTGNERFISAFLRDAIEYAKEGHGDKSFLEFETMFSIKRPEIIDQWIKVFKQDFGEKTAIRSSDDQDMNAVHQAQHVGLNMVTLPNSIAKSLISLRGSEGEIIPSYLSELSEAIENTIDIPESDLTDYERKMIENLYKYNKYLPQFGDTVPIQKIKVYDYDPKYQGAKADGIAGKGNAIEIRRGVLNGDLLRLGDVFFHESGHAITGAHDADKAFRDFFTYLLSAHASSELEDSINDNGVADGITSSEIEKTIKEAAKREKRILPGLQEVGEKNEQ